jgi:hypothetical protein
MEEGKTERRQKEITEARKEGRKEEASLKDCNGKLRCRKATANQE